MADREHYNVRPEIVKGELNFYFESVGQTVFAKKITYSPTGEELEGKLIYNLGFGDYNEESEKTHDTNINNNGDVYKVFNTVLHTVPLFFKENPHSILLVEGSDSSPDYIEFCKLSCARKCTDKCKKEGRRIALYCRYINNSYSTLSKEYIFDGGIEYDSDIIVENYVVGKPYTTILIYKRNKLTL